MRSIWFMSACVVALGCSQVMASDPPSADDSATPAETTTDVRVRKLIEASSELVRMEERDLARQVLERAQVLISQEQARLAAMEVELLQHWQLTDTDDVQVLHLTAMLVEIEPMTAEVLRAVCDELGGEPLPQKSGTLTGVPCDWHVFGETVTAEAVVQSVNTHGGSVRILSRPHLSALDGQATQIQVGTQIPVVDGGTISPMGKAVPVIRQDFAGIDIVFTPQFTADDQIELAVAATRSHFSDTMVPVFTDTRGTVYSQPIKDIATESRIITIPRNQVVLIPRMASGGPVEEDDGDSHASAASDLMILLLAEQSATPVRQVSDLGE